MSLTSKVVGTCGGSTLTSNEAETFGIAGLPPSGAGCVGRDLPPQATAARMTNAPLAPSYDADAEPCSTKVGRIECRSSAAGLSAGTEVLELHVGIDAQATEKGSRLAGSYDDRWVSS